MTGVGTQLGLLLWKNWLLQKRKVLVTIFEIALPLLFAAFLLLMRSYVPYNDFPNPTVYDPFTVNRFSRTLIPPTSTRNSTPPLYWKIAFSPSTNLTRDIASRMVDNMKPISSLIRVGSAVGFETEDEMVKFFKKQNTSSSDYLAGVAFHDIDETDLDLPTDIKYSIRLQSSPRNSPEGLVAQIQWPTTYLFPFYQFPIPREKNSTRGGFPGWKTRNVSVLLRRYPYPPYYDDRYVSILQFNFPDVIMFGVILIALNIARSVTHEKEKRLKESMKMMGLSNWIHWTAWFLKSLIYCFIVMILMSIFFLVPLKSVGAAVVNNTEPLILFIFLMMYSIATIMYSFMISSFFSKANSATVAAGGLFFVSYTPYYFSLLWYESVSLAGKISIGLFCHNTAMGYGGLLIALFEGTGTGVTWENINEPVSVDDDLTFLTVIILLGGCSVFYGLVTWYVEAVFPGEYGMPKPWYFFATRDYWLGPKLIKVDVIEDHELVAEKSIGDGDFFEAEPKDLKPGVKIRQLRKVFDKGKVAVNGVSMNMFKGQITVLLGHNGAGKTTTLSMLTVCFLRPAMKGLTKSEAAGEVDHYVEATGLTDKRKQYAKSLSGGMKRKLSVGIALIADSKVVMLDEPTSGMDPDARRFTWDLLQRHREDRTILLTTHFMDEADLLGDRIAVMSHGVLQCFGSSLFLKKKYGVGYHMAMVKEPECDTQTITKVIQSFVPGALMESNAGAELSFVLPEESVTHFEALFTKIEKEKQELKISGYGASLTTMEEVFLKVGEQSEENLSELNGFTNQVYLRDETNALNPQQNPVDYEATTAIDGANGTTVHPAKDNHNDGPACPDCDGWSHLTGGIPEEEQLDPLTLTTEPYGESIVHYANGVGNLSTSMTRRLGHLYASQFGNTTSVEFVNSTEREGMIDYLLDSAVPDIPNFNRLNLVSATFNEIGPVIVATGYFNNQPYHCAPLALSSISNAYMKYFIGEEYSITPINHPLPATLEQQLLEGTAELGYGSLMAFDLIFGLSFLSSSFAVFLIQEIATKAKHLQFISGIQLSNFWISRLLWDLFVYSIPCLLIILMFLISGLEAYSTEGRAGVAFVIFLMHGWAVIPLTYLLSFMFKEPSTGYARIIILNMFLSLLMYFIVEILKVEDFDLLQVANILDNVFMLVPPYAMAVAIDDLYVMYQTRLVCFSLPPVSNRYCDQEGFNYGQDYFRWSDGGIGRPITYMAFTGLFYFALVFVVDSRAGRRLFSYIGRKVCRKSKQLVFSEMLKDTGAAIDDDVSAERERVNGAGKTTTFKMLTGDEAMTTGHAYIDGYNVKTETKQAQQRMGYCPQFDALIDKMTGRETLTMFARLRGVPEKDIPDEVNQLMKAFMFEEHADKIAGAYSGGNRRKLSTAIALVGEPPVVFLDEPTTGMDPVARRSLWDSLSVVRESGKCIILTSHSMEECEALCTRLAIMVNGQFKCLGSTQHLKTRFGEGYTILARVFPDSPLEPLKEFIRTNFPGAKLKDEHQNMVHYHITTEGLTWGQVFGDMERNKTELAIEDYSVSQTSLEQVFLNFARRQREDPNESK
ncbi:putative ATP-binding cassette sub-family A member 3 [Apostichopus japonicus]|uniref:Putative ATP-binding cassette sub-family A member 3 n=1 Tax=Stichopus japonicus TaxID=307972 RepID=A0A2G8L3W7_STIJA|nr:putative ATP-binding cassette sub-family A member 3 [Apostichopus japonicus]